MTETELERIERRAVAGYSNTPIFTNILDLTERVRVLEKVLMASIGVADKVD